MSAHPCHRTPLAETTLAIGKQRAHRHFLRILPLLSAGSQFRQACSWWLSYLRAGWTEEIVTNRRPVDASHKYCKDVCLTPGEIGSTFATIPYLGMYPQS